MNMQDFLFVAIATIIVIVVSYYGSEKEKDR
jgi:hypothetical protein